MPEDGSPETSLNDELADLVASKLKEQGLIPADKQAEVTGRLASGTATQEDWKLWIDLAQHGKTGGDGDGTT